MPERQPNRPTGGNPSGPERDHGGRVLFDPSAHVPYEDPRLREGRGRRLLVMLIGLTLLVVAGYGAYTTRDQWLLVADEPGPLPIPLVESGQGGERAPEEPRLEALSRTELSGQADSSMALTVRAVGPSGPIAGSSIVFEVAEGEATLSSESSPTDERGVARAELSLPSRAGTVSVTARLAGSALQATFNVRVLPGPPARIAGLQGDGQSAEVDQLLERVALVVVDAAGNPVPDVEVRFSTAAGFVGPSRVRTDSLGLASTLWRLGPEPGPQRLTAAVEALDTTVTFRATAAARPVVADSRPPPVEARPVNVVPRDFVIGTSHACALAGGSVSCRGASVRGQGAAAASGFLALASGGSHVCGLDPAGNASCWGANEGGQLGDGTRSDRESPVPVRTELRLSTITAGVTHSCGLAGGGVPICWGQNLNGQIGDGSRVDRLTPVTVGGGVQFTSLVAGWNHTCGLSGNGNAFCWGLNSDGQLGDGSQLDQLTPTLVRASIQSSLAAGAAHTCGIGAGQVLCWGDNRFGQLGDGTTQGRGQPRPVEGLPGPATQLAAGAVHTCALSGGGFAYCWGQNLHGQLGDGSLQNSTRAVPVAGDIRFRSIHAGGALTCGFSTDGTQYCWGLNQSGQLGDGTRQSRSTPTPVG
jgi:alpha-tubulin suppressor-like RCC1 family protein